MTGNDIIERAAAGMPCLLPGTGRTGTGEVLRRHVAPGMLARRGQQAPFTPAPRGPR